MGDRDNPYEVKHGKEIGLGFLIAGVIFVIVGLTLFEGENSLMVAGVFGTCFVCAGFAMLFTTVLAAKIGKKHGFSPTEMCGHKSAL